jgi:hypothetical protein
MKQLVILAMMSLQILAVSDTTNAQSYQLRGSIREWIKVFSQSPNEVDLSETRLKLELLSTLGENSAFSARSYYVYDGLDKVGNWDIQEAYIDYYSHFLDVRFGKQIIAWGKADEINPTDILNPQDLSNITEDKGTRKIGLLALKTEWKFCDFILEGIWKPEFDNMRMPALGSRWAFFTIPGLDSLPEPEFPPHKLRDTEWALRLSRTVQLFDFSVIYFDGWDNIATPVMVFDPDLQQSYLDKLKFYRTRMIGADFAGSVSSVGVWGEGAYFIPEDSDSDSLVKNPYLQYVLGVDYTFGYEIKVNVQYFQEINETTGDESIVSKLGFGIPLQQAVSCRVEKSFGYGDTRNVEVFTIYDIKDRGLLFQPKFSVSPEDAFEIELGYILYSGTDESVFGRFEENDQVYLKGTYSF